MAATVFSKDWSTKAEGLCAFQLVPASVCKRSIECATVRSIQHARGISINATQVLSTKPVLLRYALVLRRPGCVYNLCTVLQPATASMTHAFQAPNNANNRKLLVYDTLYTAEHCRTQFAGGRQGTTHSASVTASWPKSRSKCVWMGRFPDADVYSYTPPYCSLLELNKQQQYMTPDQPAQQQQLLAADTVQQYRVLSDLA